MAKTEGFRFLPSYYEAIRDIPDDERLALYDAILDFGFGNDPGELSSMAKALFCLIKPTLERSIRFEAKQKANGRKGGRPPKNRNCSDDAQEKPRGNPGKSQQEPSETQIESGENLAVAVALDVAVESAVEGENSADKPPIRSRFVPPTVDEVKAYCRERGNSVDPDAFIDFYTANGWVQGKGKPIKDWKAAVRTWERRKDLDPKRERARVKTAMDYETGGDFFSEGSD